MATKTLLTWEQFEQLPDDDMRHELDEGELISMPPTFTLHGKIQAQISAALLNFVRQHSLGVVTNDSGFRLSPDTVRAPDISFVRADRARAVDLERRFEGAPDLAVEVISPSETATQIARKVQQYLRAGTETVWVVYPREQTIHVFESSHNARILEAADQLESPALLPGFSIRVSDLFE